MGDRFRCCMKGAQLTRIRIKQSMRIAVAVAADRSTAVVLLLLPMLLIRNCAADPNHCHINAGLDANTNDQSMIDPIDQSMIDSISD